MRVPVLCSLFAALAVFAADEPKPTEAPKGDTPAAKPAEKAAPKAKKLMGIPEIPDGISIADGVKLQDAWSKAQGDPTYLATVGTGKAKGKGDEDKKTKGVAREKKASREGIDEALEKAMLRADSSLKPELVRTYLEASRQKAGDRPKKAK